VVTKLSSARGRPREFDLETALDSGQRLFHAGGYENVGIAAITEALGIKPPSFYKAFGSKAAFFLRIIERYSSSGLKLEEILVPERPPAEALAELLLRTAQAYARNPKLRGCLVLEAARGCDDDEVCKSARRAAELPREKIRTFVARSNPTSADLVTDYIASTMSGLSGSAREGMSKDRLVAVARAAAMGLEGLLQNDARRARGSSASAAKS
jgi:TetR/AcrR family transcriptional repressor for divergent bdcA